MKHRSRRILLMSSQTKYHSMCPVAAPELVTKAVAQEQQEQTIETRTAVERIAGFTIVATAVAVLAVVVATAVLRAGQVLAEIAERQPGVLRNQVPHAASVLADV